MDYQKLYRELDRNIYAGNRYMLNKLITRTKELLNSKDSELRHFAEENIKQLKKLKEPYDQKTGELIHHTDHILINGITDELIAILKNKEGTASNN